MRTSLSSFEDISILGLDTHTQYNLASMKKPIVLALSLTMVLSTFAFTSCRKGENDPFFSLLSRRARLVADFTLIEGETIVTTVVDGDSDVSMTFYEDGQMRDGVRTWKLHHYNLNFESDNTYSYSWKQTLETEYGVPVVDPPTITFSGTGIWSWLGANKDQDIKNKEGVVMRVTSSEQRYLDGTVYTGATRTGFVDGDIIMLDKLNNFKMRYKVERTHTYPDGDQIHIRQSMHFDRHI